MVRLVEGKGVEPHPPATGFATPVGGIIDVTSLPSKQAFLDNFLKPTTLRILIYLSYISLKKIWKKNLRKVFQI
jgi:hypothetical protein